MIDLGGTVTLAATVQDSAGANANATTVNVTVTLPDGTSVPLTPANPPGTTGNYQVDYVPVQSGLHAVRWVTTVPNRGHTDEFYVQGSSPSLIVSLQDAKDHLRIKKTGDDDKLRLFVEAASKVIEDDPEFGVGPVVRRTFSEVVYPTRRGGALALSNANVISLTSGTLLRYGTAVDLTYIYTDNSMVRPQFGYGGFMPIEPWTVVYTAGLSTVRTNIRLACLQIVEHLWNESQRGTQNVRIGEVDDADFTSMGYLVPYSAMKLLAGESDVAGGFA